MVRCSFGRNLNGGIPGGSEVGGRRALGWAPRALGGGWKKLTATAAS